MSARRGALAALLALSAVSTLLSPSTVRAQSGATYSVLPAQLSGTAGSATGPAAVRIDLPAPYAEPNALTLRFRAQLPPALAGLATVTPDAVSLTLAPRSRTAQSGPFTILLAPGAPAGGHTVEIVREPAVGALLDVGSAVVTRLRLTVLSAPVGVRTVAPGALQLRVNPTQAQLAPGETTQPVAVDLVFPSPIANPSGTIVVTLPPQLVGNTQVAPAPLAFGARGTVSQVRTTMRLATRPDTPVGRWPIGLRFAAPDLGTAETTFILEVRSRGDLTLAFEPAQLALCDGGPGVRGVLRVTGANGYRGRPGLRWGALAPGLTALPVALPAVQLPPDAAVPFELRAQGVAATTPSLAVTASDAAAGLQRSATLAIRVTRPDFAPAVGPPPVAIAQSAPARAFQLTLNPNPCLSAASVRVTLAGAPAGLLVTGFPFSFVGPGYAPLTFTLRAMPQLAVGSYPLVATFTAPGLAAKQLAIAVDVQAPGRAQLLQAPAIDVVEPNQVQRGQQVDLKLVGRNLKAGTQLTFGAGIQLVGLPLFATESDGRVRIYVEPQAPLGLHLATAQNASGASEGPGGLLVQTPVAAAVPRIDKVEPPQVEPGKSYLVKLTGENLSPAISVDLGAGVSIVGPLLAAGPSAIAAKIAVAPNAPSGKRLAAASAAGGSSQGPGTLAVGGPPAQPTQVFAASPLPFPQGIILLEYPEWGTKDMSNFQAGYKQELGVPALSDATRFEWREKNPGTADYFELRVLDRKGEKVVATRRIQAGMTIAGVKYPTLPDFYRPDPTFIQELAASLPAAQQAIALGPTTAQLDAATAQQLAAPGTASATTDATVQLGPQPFGGAAPDPLEAAGPRDFLWQVAGFWLPKSAPASGGSPSASASLAPTGPAAQATIGSSTPPTGLEVEISERWPLRLARKPNGLDCPAGGKSAEIHAENLDSLDQNTYVGDRVQLDGSLSLEGSPYEAKATPQPDPFAALLEQYNAWQEQVENALDSLASAFGGGGGSGSSAPSQPSLSFWDRYKFDNVFIDWGDGAVEPLVATTDTKTLYWSSYQKLTLLAGGFAPTHAYKHPGTYVIRIYQLAAADLQKIDPAKLAFAVDGYTGDPLVQLASLQAGGAGGTAPSLPWLGAAATSAQEIASRAYMLFCAPVLVIPRVDPCARGRLNLTAIDILGFPGHDVADTASGAVSQLSAQSMGNVGQFAAPPAVPAGSTAAAQGTAAASQAKPAVQGGAISTLGVKVDGTATDCDEAMTARARLSFFGKGKAVVRFRWEDGTVFYTSPTLDLASEPRTTLGNDPSQWGDPKISTVDVDAPLSVDELGVHGIAVEAEVIFDPFASILGAMLGAAGGQGDVACPNAGGDAAPALFAFPQQSPAGGAVATASSSQQVFQVGALLPTGLSPQAQGAPSTGAAASAVLGLGAMSTAQPIAPHPSGKKSPPDFVQSPVHKYKVVSADPTKPCFFLFPTPQGIFRVTDVNANVVAEGNGRFSGQGLLKFPLTAGPDSYSETPLAVPIKSWLASDAQTVEEGALAATPGQELTVPGMRARIDGVQGQAGQFMKAKLGLRPIQQSLVQPTAGWSSEQPITDKGNWIAGNEALAVTAIGASGFGLESDEVTLDLSRDQGPGAGTASCGSTGPPFAGIHLGQATIHPFDFGLGGTTGTVSGWVVGPAGLCGASQLSGLPQKSLGDGWLKLGAIDVKAFGGGFAATYKGLQVFSPWFGKPLGPVDVKMFDSGGASYGFSLPGLGDAELQDWGTVSMKATALELVREDAVGWALHGGTRFRFNSPDEKFFAQFDTDRLLFRLADSGVYFQGGKTSTNIPLQGVAQPSSPQLGKASIDLLGVDLISNPGGGEALKFHFETLLKLSSAPELESPKVHTGFVVGKQGAGFAAAGPNTAPFESKMAFPLGNPQIDGTAAPAYQPGSTFFCGGLDMSLLGGSGLIGGSATFVLAFDEATGKDGWLAHYKLPIAGGAGITIAPPLPINLFAIEGGLAYNIAAQGADPKKGSNPFADPPSCKSGFALKDSGVIFAAGVEVGTTDHTTVTARGMFSVSKAFGVRLDVDAWLLTVDHSGAGDIQGVLKWENGAFIGKFWGGYEFLEDPFFGGGYAVDLDLGASESSAAVDILFDSSGDWHVKAGDQYGTPITGRVLFAKSESWLGLSGKGISNLKLTAGGKQSIGVSGEIWECTAKAGAEFACGVEMGIDPFKIGGTASAKFGISLCGVGFSLSGNVSLGCCAPYANVNLCADIVPCISCGDWGCWPSLCEACGGFSL